MATKPLAPGQSKISLRMVGPHTSKKPQTMRVAVDFHTKATGSLSKEGQRVMDAMLDAAKLEDARIRAEQDDTLKLIETPLWSPHHGKIVSQRLMLNDDEFEAFGVRDAREDEDTSAMEQWD